ncbi:MAG: YbhB/YbcL family Raf kinase inhibitor-like protein [Candidatus Omnitrophica bacterium]|nr:YbhB/YbcL family Raf kinase inhibitor-like protein [Candidatus Omnitrophota bacterium]
MKTICIFLAVIFAGLSAFAFDIESEAFIQKGYIPDRYTCDSKDLSPELTWSDVPSGAKSLALICDDPDAPFTTWVHWLLINIPTDYKKLSEGISVQDLKDAGIVLGKNDFGKLAYGGPCPPKGKPHRYFFKLYALDTTLSLPEGFSKDQVIKAIQGHIIAETKIIGLYQRK